MRLFTEAWEALDGGGAVPSQGPLCNRRTESLDVGSRMEDSAKTLGFPN